MSSWLKARDWVSGLEYSSLFHSGLRAISLSSLRPPASNEPIPPQLKKVVRPRPSSMLVCSTKELDELWVTKATLLGGVHDDQKFIQGGADGMVLPVPDSVDSSSRAHRSRSFYVNLKNSCPLPSKEESCFPLSNDPEALHRRPRRERPVSTQTMPLPSIFSPAFLRDRGERDHAWMLEDSSPEMKAQDDGENADVTEINLDGVLADWRQFHVDWLQDEHV